MKKLYKLLAYSVGGFIGIWFGAKFLLPVGLPFLLGWMLAALTTPAVSRITQRCKLPYGLISFGCVTLLSAVIVLLFWLLAQLLINELEHLGHRLPELLSSLSQPLTAVQNSLLHFASKLPESMAVAATQWIERLFEGSSILVSSASQWLISLAGELLSWVPDLIMFLLTTVLSAYLFAAEAPSIKAFFRKHIPQEWMQKLKTVQTRLKTALLGYAKAQGKLMIITFVIIAIGLLLLRRNHALLLALIIAVVDALPIFGAGTILLPWSIFSFLRGSSATGIGLLVLYAVSYLARTILEPRMIGKQLGLSPLLTLIALYAGYRLFGIWGMLLLPLAAILLKQLYDLTREV